MQRIVTGGPYFVFGRPLMLKIMPTCFEFQEDVISLTPIWASLPSLPLECWNLNALSKIGSRLGNPMAIDSLTIKMKWISYARILVEVDASKKLVDQVEFILPNGVVRKQAVVYEFTPKFCTTCNYFGHLTDACHPPAATVATNPAATLKTIVPKEVQPSEWTLVQRLNKNQKHVQQQQDPLTAGSDEQCQQGLSVPKPCIPAAGSSGSSIDSGSPSMTDLVAPVVSNGNRSWEGIPLLTPHEDQAFWRQAHAPAITKILHRSFSGWCHTHNFDTIAGVCLSSSGIRQLLIFTLRTYHHKSFTAGSMWEKLMEVGLPLTLLWLILGYFNCVKSTAEKQLGVVPTWYEHKDFNDCCLSLGLTDAPTTDWYYTWKLKALKNPLKSFNRLHDSHISVRAKEADLAFQNAQLHLESNPGDTVVRDSLGDLRKKAIFLTERNVAKSSILAITKSDGSTITSATDIGQEFVAYCTSLLGTEAQTLPVDSDVFEWGPKVSSEHALELCKMVTSLEEFMPKSEHSPTVADYRPISCCNVIYKAIMKIIADQLAPAMENLIDRSQAAFVGGRSITDNIFLAQEMVRQYTRKRISPHLALNGSLHGFFPGKRGLRQGDPMSPALFLLSMEFFSRLVKRRTSDSEFNFYPKCEKLKITSSPLCRRFDAFLPRRPSIYPHLDGMPPRVPGRLRPCCQYSKSSIFTASIQNDELHGILTRTGFARGEPIRYLGIPLAAQRLSIIDYSPLVDQIAKSISKWAAKSLLYAGRLELIRSVIQGEHRSLGGNLPSQGGRRSGHPTHPDLERGPPCPSHMEHPPLVTDFGSSEAAIQHMEAWTNNKGLETSKAYEYFRRKRTRRPWQMAI
ncbi:UNVERIFIED_CONTAM: hypothetical protein Slati_3791400 [Sesamum latifolium]|uniref:Reverse transcriptase domain-containing protein n=1 Tax=Sesamum latifolium TaxID=2727402 RepID=A0AAW2U516_9LAMI